MNKYEEDLLINKSIIVGTLAFHNLISYKQAAKFHLKVIDKIPSNYKYSSRKI